MGGIKGLFKGGDMAKNVNPQQMAQLNQQVFDLKFLGYKFETRLIIPNKSYVGYAYPYSITWGGWVSLCPSPLRHLRTIVSFKTD
jgi:hypothetical protein